MFNQPGAKVEYGSISLMDKSDAKKIIDTKLEYINGTLLASLKPGKYSLSVNANGFSPFQKEVVVLEKSTDNIFDDIHLTSLGKSSGVKQNSFKPSTPAKAPGKK
jgi:hypothetical protein